MTTATRTASTQLPPESDAMSPGKFMRQMRKLMKTRSAPAAVAFYDQHGPPLLEHLSETQQLQLEEIMHWADTVVELQAGPAARR